MSVVQISCLLNGACQSLRGKVGNVVSRGQRIPSSHRSRLCMVTYNLPESSTLFCSTLIFFPCFVVALSLGFLKRAKEFLIGSWMERVRSVFC